MQKTEAPTGIDCSTPFDIHDLPDPGFDNNALVILENRYLIKGEDNNILETPKELVWRVAVFVASAEILYSNCVYSLDGGFDRYIECDMFNPTFCDVTELYIDPLGKHEYLKDVMHVYHIPEGIITSLFRSWYYYQKLGRMKVDYAELMTIYAEDFEVKILPIAKKYYQLIARLMFMPNTPTLMNSGLERSLLSGCFVLPVKDELVSILNTCRDAALVHKAGGGTGFAFSRLRPRKDVVDGRPNGASGPVSFMKVFNTTTGEIKQGFSRRGANMGVLNVHHPDIMEFISCKIPPEGATYVSPDDVPFSNFNISVAVTDNFMKSVKRGSKHPLINPRNGEIVDAVDAKMVWDKIIHNAWKNGDPGMIFIDEMNRYNPTPKIGDYESTNPCGEQILLPHESCNLGAINLNGMLEDENINYDLLESTIRLCVRFLNGVLDMNYFPLEKIEKLTRGNRKIGLGYMGFADVLYRLKIPYDQSDAFDLGRRLAKTLTDVARNESIKLAKKRGPFPNVDISIYADEEQKPFNAALTTIAPTGTTGIIANSVSGGIEPITFLRYHRRTFEGDVLETLHPVFMEQLKDLGLDDKRVLDHVHEHGTISDIQPPDIFDDGYNIQRFGDLQEIFKVAHDIDYKAHIKMQAAFQENIDSSISKTINFPSSATEEDVENAFLMAFEMKCKGVTIYRDGSKDWQVINASRSKKQEEHIHAKPMKLPDDLPALKSKVETGCGKIHITVTYDPKSKQPLELFVEMGKSGGCAYAWAHGLGRLVSIQLRYGLPVDDIIEQLKNIQCPNPLSRTLSCKEEKISSCVDAIAIVLRDFSSKVEGKKNNNVSIKDRESRKDCPRCGSGHLVHTEGCVKCQNCDWSKCD